jgi:hypothetical protein
MAYKAQGTSVESPRRTCSISAHWPRPPLQATALADLINSAMQSIMDATQPDTQPDKTTTRRTKAKLVSLPDGFEDVSDSGEDSTASDTDDSSDVSSIVEDTSEKRTFRKRNPETHYTNEDPQPREAVSEEQATQYLISSLPQYRTVLYCCCGRPSVVLTSAYCIW